MGHGAAPDLAGFEFLREVRERHVLPAVPAQVEHDRVRPTQRVAEGRQPVVVFDLRRVLLSRQQTLRHGLHEGVAETRPVHARKGHGMGVEAARRAAELRRVAARLELVHAGL